VRLVIAGAGPLQSDLAQLATAVRAPVTFAGFRNQAELPAFYDLADLLVLSSTGHETWGLVVNEAMACGTPAVIADSVGCAPDLIDQGRTGSLYPCRDVPALAAAIAALLGRKGEPEVQQALAAKTAAYSPAAAADGVCTALDELRRA
jgi:glycosyltransferase involved in cell wall biosynthesis